MGALLRTGKLVPFHIVPAGFLILHFRVGVWAGGSSERTCLLPGGHFFWVRAALLGSVLEDGTNVQERVICAILRGLPCGKYDFVEGSRGEQWRTPNSAALDAV